MEVPVDAHDSTERLKDLVRAAFRAAQVSGKSEWRIMTTPVLKNRLLQLTQNEFRESEYGSTHLLPLLREMPDLVEIIEDGKPPLKVRLLDSEITPALSEVDPVVATTEHGWLNNDLQGTRIRYDLWRSVMDYSSGITYVLDETDHKARPKVDNETNHLILPTVTGRQVEEWRKEFVQSLSDREVPISTAWIEGAGRTVDLPGKYRPAWNKFLKSKVVNHLIEWFESNGLNAPTDILVERTERLPISFAGQQVAAHEALRAALIASIQRMDYESLKGISMPATALLAFKDSLETPSRRRS